MTDEDAVQMERRLTRIEMGIDHLSAGHEVIVSTLSRLEVQVREQNGNVARGQDRLTELGKHVTASDEWIEMRRIQIAEERGRDQGRTALILGVVVVANGLAAILAPFLRGLL